MSCGLCEAPKTVAAQQLLYAKEKSQQIGNNVCQLHNGCCLPSALQISQDSPLWLTLTRHTEWIVGNVLQPSQVGTLQRHQRIWHFFFFLDWVSLMSFSDRFIWAGVFFLLKAGVKLFSWFKKSVWRRKLLLEFRAKLPPLLEIS